MSVLYFALAIAASLLLSYTPMVHSWQGNMLMALAVTTLSLGVLAFLKESYCCLFLRKKRDYSHP